MKTVSAHLDGAGGYREHDLLVLTENAYENLTLFLLDQNKIMLTNAKYIYMFVMEFKIYVLHF